MNTTFDDSPFLAVYHAVVGEQSEMTEVDIEAPTDLGGCGWGGIEAKSDIALVRGWRTGEPGPGANKFDVVTASHNGTDGKFFANTKGPVADIAGITNADGRREVVVFDEDPAPLHLVATVTPTGERHWIATRGAAAAPAEASGCGPGP